MTKTINTPKITDWDDAPLDFDKETTELVVAVKELNRSVTTLNKALLRLQQRVANHAHQGAATAPERQLH